MDAVTFSSPQPGIALITLNRPASRNAIDGALLDGLDAALDAVSSDSTYRVAVLTGAGRGFSAGADRSGRGAPWTPKASSQWKQMYDAQVRLTDQMTRLYELPIPTIAAVHGAAVGGGLAFALHCDLRIAAADARFGCAFITAGFSSMDMGTSYLLPKIVGAGHARDLMLSGRHVLADEGYRMGLVTSVVPSDELLDRAIERAQLLAANNAYGLWQTKIGLNAALDAPSLRHAKELENRTQIIAGFTGNPEEAGVAFLERRQPVWKPL